MRIVGGKFRGKKISSPSSEKTRPTADRTRETLFNILLHNPHLGPNVFIEKHVLDVFAGTGALGLEAYSRGAKSVSFIENHRYALKSLRENVISFDLTPSCIIAGDPRKVGQAKKPFDILFFDPPYHKDLVAPSLLNLNNKGWISPEAILVIEIAKDEVLELPESYKLLIERISGAAKLLFYLYHT